MKFNKNFFITDDYLSVAFTTLFSWFFRRNVLFFKVFLAFCLMHVFAIELNLQENFVRTGELSRKIVSIERLNCWQR